VSNTPNNRSNELLGIVKAIGAVLGVWTAVFTVINNIVTQPITALTVALVAAVIVSVWVVSTGWIGITQIFIGWLSLVVVVLLVFVFWPRTMTVEGFVYDEAGNLVSNQEVLFFDLSGRRYETKTDAEGFYQFQEVPTGRYRILVFNSEIEGETQGILVRVVKQNITTLGSSASVPPTPTPIPTSTPCPTTGETTFERVKCTGVVRVGIANEYPYGFKNSDGSLSGEAIEVARVIFNRLGIPAMEGVEKEFGSLIPSLQDGSFDVITAGMWIRPERCQQVLFADPEYKSIIEGTPEPLFGAAAFRKEDADFRDAFNIELQKLKNSGELGNIITQYKGDYVGETSPAGIVEAEELCNP